MPKTPGHAGKSLVEVLYEDVVPRLKVQDVYEGVRFIAKGPRYLRGGCPLHGGKDANFSVNLETLSWTCFSHCGHGSVVSYLNGGVPARGERFREIVADLARRANVEIEWKTTPDSPDVQARLRRRELLEGFAVLAQRQLNGPDATPAIDYLESRGFPADARELSRLGLGYIPNGVNLHEALKATPDEVSSNGLRDPRWRSRVIIPWRDRNGHVSTFLGRSIQPDAQIRYLYLRGATIPPFFGFERVQLGRPDTLLIVESPLDAVLLWHHGVDNVVAVGGSALTEKHLEILRQDGTRTVILALDADDAGRTAADRFVRLAASNHADLRVQVVPPERYGGVKDPGEFVVQQGDAAIGDLIDARVPAAVYQATVALRETHRSSPIALRRDAMDRLIVIADGLAGPERLADVEDIVGLAVPRLGYPEAVIRNALGAVPLPAVDRSASTITPPWQARALGEAVDRGPLPDEKHVPPASVSKAGNVSPNPGDPAPGREAPFGDQIAETLKDLEVPISVVMLTHLLRGSSGPATSGLVSRYSPRHVGALATVPFTEARDMVDRTCRLDPRIKLLDRRVSLQVGGTAKVEGIAQAANHGKPWSPEEKLAAARGWAEGQSLGQLADALDRSPGGVAGALVRMGAVESREEARERLTSESDDENGSRG